MTNHDASVFFLVDSPDKEGWSHLASNDIDALHAFADNVGLHKRWFHNKRNRPHYDVRGEMRRKVIEAGAKEVHSREIVKLLQSQFD